MPQRPGQATTRPDVFLPAPRASGIVLAHVSRHGGLLPVDTTFALQTPEPPGGIMNTVLITGATSGFGAATARRFAQAGVSQVIALEMRDDGRLKSVVDAALA